MLRRRLLNAAVLAILAACGAPTGSPASPATPASPGPVTPPPASSSASASATPQPIPSEPALGQTFGLFYDPLLEHVVLVNGATEDGPARPTELWRWTGDAWGLLDAAGPPARGFAAIGRDPERGVVVVHGGIGSSGAGLDETLEWDGRAWTIHDSPGPGAREGAALAYDEDDGQMVLFGGAIGGVQPGDTWAWNGAAWERLADAGPRPRFVSLMASDQATGDILLQGGHWVDGNDGAFLDDTWRWSGNRWAQVANGEDPGPRVNSPGAWDERLGGIVMFGGGTGAETPFEADTWLWSSAWSELSPEPAPSPRNGHALAFDAKRQVLVLVGGIGEPGGAQRLDVWELGVDGWRQAWPRP